MTYLNREHLLDLADRCEAGADDLTYEGEHAAEVLADRAGGAQLDPQEWAARKTAAAAAARQYAANLRAEADTMRENQHVPEPRIREAEKVADAAGLGGILIDSSRLDDAALQSRYSSEAEKQAIRDSRAERQAAVEGSGMFDHIAEPGRVPYWQLAGEHADQRQPDTDTAAVDDADGF